MKTKINLNLDRRGVIFIIFAALFLLELGLLLPLEIRKICALNKQIAEIKNKLVNVKRDWPNKNTYLEKRETLKENIGKIKTRFFLPRQESGALSFISAESQNFDIKIEFLKPQAVQDYMSTKFGVVNYLPITVKAFGRYHNLARFLEYLEKGRYFFEVKELNVVGGSPYDAIDMVICGLIKE